jgi:hypothetical protein
VYVLIRNRYAFRCGGVERPAAAGDGFWRVYQDTVPVALQPPELDDAAFTAGTEEAEGLTQASYLGTASGYGARLVLTGASACGPDDRELTAGAVQAVEVSDQSTSAAAAALDADARTEQTLGSPLSRCDPRFPYPCSLDSNELAFDDKEGCADGDGRNHYAVGCLEDEGARSGPPQSFRDKKAVPRDGFSASVTCDRAHEKASGSATGALTEASLDGDPADPTDGIRVGHSSSTVTVTRTLGEGVTVKVDSIARNVVIPGVGTIGAVRAEAVSVANGRRGGARTDYTRTVCGVDLPGFSTGATCVEDEDTLRRRLNAALTGRAEVRLRQPDPALAEGTEHGYLAAVTRDRRELFGDRIISRDRSGALPGLEILLYNDGEGGANRRILQLAGVEASTSYGIACLYGQVGANCVRDALSDDTEVALPPEPGEPEVVTVVEEVEVPAEAALDDGGGDTGTGGGGVVQRIVRLLKRGPEAVAQALRLLFNNPRELGLLAAVWALLWAPCWLGERRRSIGGLRARRAAVPTG